MEAIRRNHYWRMPFEYGHVLAYGIIQAAFLDPLAWKALGKSGRAGNRGQQDEADKRALLGAGERVVGRKHHRAVPRNAVSLR
jgi:hypothetical protein